MSELFTLVWDFLDLGCTLSAIYPAGWVVMGGKAGKVGLEPKLATSTR